MEVVDIVRYKLQILLWKLFHVMSSS